MLLAHEKIKGGKGNPALEDCFRDLGWPLTELSLDMVALLVQSNFDPSCPASIRLAELVFQGSSSTKDVMEAVFAHLRDISCKSQKSQRMSNDSKWFYCTTATSPMTGGHDRFLPSQEDLARYIESPAFRQGVALRAKHIYDMRSTLLPGSAKFDADNIAKTKWRPAGPLSHQRSAAAGAVLVELAKSEFKSIGDTWAGFSFNIDYCHQNNGLISPQ